jgi:hypothetical protein
MFHKRTLFHTAQVCHTRELRYRNSTYTGFDTYQMKPIIITKTPYPKTLIISSTAMTLA